VRRVQAIPRGAVPLRFVPVAGLSWGGAAVTEKRSSGVFAVFRPSENDIALFVDDGEGRSAVALEVAEARAIHGALDGALRIAACRDEPARAVPEFRPVKGAPL
jgi:hypothetical protein